jgi:hypothetical protein
MKTLTEIREHLRKQGLHKPNYQDQCRDFISKELGTHQIAITLTLKKSWIVKNGKMDVKLYLSNTNIETIWKRFLHILNKLIWKNEYKNKGITLTAIGALENGFGNKHDHIHGALGNFPKDFNFKRLSKLVKKASNECFEINTQHKEKFCDSGWIDYMTKEVSKKVSDKVFW